MPEAPRAKPPRPPQGVPPRDSTGTPGRVFQIVFICAFSVVGLVTLATVVLHQYGVSLFMLIPFATGFASAYLANMGEKWNWPRTAIVVSLTLAITGFLMLGLEGFICIALASGLAVALAVIGALIAMLVARLSRKNRTLLIILTGICPLSIGFEHRFPPSPPTLEQTTIIEIDAPPEEVWRFVPAFPKIGSAPTGLLAVGMAYPVEANMQGEGIGAQRECVLSTGSMPEIITRWEPGRALEFDVKSTPPAMEETNPFFHVHPPHVEGYFQVTHGRFVLIPLPDGRTRVEGTSWFKHDLWPQFYWAPITRRVVKEVHERVLHHIKELAEGTKRSAPHPSPNKN